MLQISTIIQLIKLLVFLKGNTMQMFLDQRFIIIAEKVICMKFSIIIPVYNVEEFLRQCIDSVIAQTYRNIEIILVNDGSPDNSKAICEEYVKQYSFVKLINKENGGISDARNVGILNSTGEYIFFLDADDYWKDDFLGDLAEFIYKNNNPDYILYKYKYYNHKKKIFRENKIIVHRDELENKNGSSWINMLLANNKKFQWFPWMGLVKRAFILENNLFFEKGRDYGDVLWTPLVFLRAQSINYFDREVYIYRIERVGQITSGFSREIFEEMVYISKYWFDNLEKAEIDRELKLRLLESLTIMYFVSIWFLDFLNPNEKKQLVTLLKENSHLLKYGKGIVRKSTKILCRSIGFNLCSKLFKVVIQLKRKLPKRGGFKK